MPRFKKVHKRTLILAGLAVFAYYKYSRMSEQQKNNLVVSLKEKSKNFYDKYIPADIKNLFTKKSNMIYDDYFGEHSDYSM
jgi:hypothetical protein